MKKALISLFLSIGVVIVNLIYKDHYLTDIKGNLFSYLACVLIIASLFMVIGILMKEIIPLLSNKMNEVSVSIEEKLSPKKMKITTLFYVAILIVVYFSCFFAYYPGTAAYDYKTSYLQALGEVELNNHHPVFYTMIWKVFQIMSSVMGKDYFAHVFYSASQILFVIASYLYIIYWMQKRKYPFIWRLITSIYYLVVPAFHLFSFSPTKDVLFSCSFILFILKYIDFINGEGKAFPVIIFGTLACLLRHNAVYILFATILVLFVMKMDKKRAVLGALPSIVIVTLFSKIFLPAIGVKDTEPAEYLSAPIQQIGALYQLDGYFSETEKTKIQELIPDVKDYNFRFADTIKNTFNNELYQSDPTSFWKIYFSGLRKQPYVYFCAFLDTNSPMLVWNSEPYDLCNEREYIELNQNPGADDFTLSLKFKFLRGFYDGIGHADQGFIKLPFIHSYFSLGFPFYCILVAFFASILCNRNVKNTKILCYIFILLILTYLLGPVSNYRYCYPLYLACPLYLGSVFVKNDE